MEETMSKVYQHIYSADKDGMHLIAASEEMIMEVCDYLERTISVSYTHLDVYKRQLLKCMTMENVIFI